MLLRNADVYGVGRADVLVAGGAVTQVGPALQADASTEVVECSGRALLPGLHDHHIHLLATAASLASTQCGPPLDRVGLADRLRAASAAGADGWVRGVGYHESVAGILDRDALDELRGDVPVRVQHRSGASWVLNGRAVEQLGLDGPGTQARPGLERDCAGRVTGVLWRADGWLGSLVPRRHADLGALSDRLAAMGVTGVTDATPGLTSLPTGMRQEVVLLGAPGATLTQPRKILVPDHDLPTLDALVADVRATRPRPVAVHCVTRVALVLVLAALTETGSVPGDRIEHAAVAPPELHPALRRLELTVVTQPSLPLLRGDDYLADVEPADRKHLWPFRSLLDAGVPVACSSDAPYGDPDPWRSIAAAAERRTVTRQPIGSHERVDAHRALLGYLGRATDPGGPPRRIAMGEPADLVLLDRGLDAALAAPSADRVAMTVLGGRVAFAATGADQAADAQ